MAESDDTGCIRSVPSAIFQTSGVRAHRFDPITTHEATERFELRSGTRVEVRYGGCEYFVTTLRFESMALFSEGYSRKNAFLAASRFLRELHELHAQTNFDLALAAKTLQTLAATGSGLEFGHDVAVKGDGIEPLDAHVQVDEALRRRGAGVVQVTLFRGPL